ncbi:MAG: hypothetical protein RL755_35 [Pseudomonadota bacterium]|jgi:single-strand DNA-binding protein
MSNVFSFTGVIGKDAEVRYLSSGQAVLNVSVANNVGFGDNQKTNWVRVALWGKRAEGNIKNYLVKGTTVFCSGELTLSEYKTNDGSTKTSMELNANILDLVGKKPDTQPSQTAPQNNHNAAKSNGYAPPPVHDYDDSIPF